MIRDAVTCDRGGCLAVYLEPDDLDLDADAFESAMAAAGWTRGPDGHRCPGCSTGAAAGLIERGDCPRCMGRRTPTTAGDRCQHCGHLTPADDADWPIS